MKKAKIEVNHEFDNDPGFLRLIDTAMERITGEIEDPRLVIAMPDAMSILILLNKLKQSMPERKFDDIGKFLSPSEDEIKSLTALFGFRHPIVSAAHAYSKMPKRKVLRWNTVCITTYRICRAREKDWGYSPRVLFIGENTWKEVTEPSNPVVIEEPAVTTQGMEAHDVDVTDEVRGDYSDHIETCEENDISQLKDRLRGLTRGALKRGGYRRSVTELLMGCTYEEMFVRLGPIPDGYDIDHIVPMAQAKTEAEATALCHYSNLQYLPHEENMRKSDKPTEKGLVLIHALLHRPWE